MNARRQSSVSVLLAAVCGLLVLAPAGLLAAQIEIFDPAKYTGPAGKIVFPYKGESVLVVQDTQSGKLYRLSTTDGTFAAPAGQYTLLGYQSVAIDENKERWAFYANMATVKTREITVAADGSQDVAAGPPFVASVSVTKGDDGNASLSFNLLGAGGDKCIVRKANTMTDPPGFQVVSAAGEVVWQGQFKYG